MFGLKKQKQGLNSLKYDFNRKIFLASQMLIIFMTTFRQIRLINGRF